MPGHHAKLGPSASDRWMQCTASVALIDRLTEDGKIAADTPSVFAAEGTVAHEIRETCLTFGMEPHDFVGSVRGRTASPSPLTTRWRTICNPASTGSGK